MPQDEEAEHLETYELPADPWKDFKSAYGGPLSTAECYDRLRKGLAGDEKLGLKEVLTLTKAEVSAELAALDPPPKSKAMAGGLALYSAVEKKGSTPHQRLLAHGCGLEGVQVTAAVSSRFVELDLSFNELASVDSLAPNCLRSIVLAGNQLLKPPCFKVEMPKLVKLDISFNDVKALPSPEAIAMMPNLRVLGLQNCMIKTLSGTGEAAGACSLSGLNNLASLDLSYNLLSSVSEMRNLTCLQRLQELDVGCNELCAQDGYEEGIKALRMKISTLKKLNDEEVRRQFGGYGLEAMEGMINKIQDAMSNDKSSCSCVEGNPCLSPDNCHNWKDRFKIAHKTRLEKYWNCGRNFDG